MRAVAHCSAQSPPVTVELIRWAAEVIGAHVRRTPVRVCELDGRPVYLKLENRQETGSFKVRGALAALAGYRERGIKGPWVTASAGNHGIGLAYAARHLGAGPVVVFVPSGTPQAKLRRLQALGAEVRLEGADFPQTERAARAFAATSGLPYISAYNDPFVIAGQGTVAVELLEEIADPAMVFIPAGGGGLLGGSALWLRSHRPRIRIWGVQSTHTPSLYNALYGTHLPERPTLAEGLAGGIEENALTLPLIRELVDGICLVNEPEIWDSVYWAHRRLGERIEASAAVALAAVRFRSWSEPGPWVAIITGANTDLLPAQ